MDTYSSNLFDYKISLNNLDDTLICVLDYNGIKWQSKITESELTSGMINLAKLTNIIQSNSQKILPNYRIGLGLIRNDRTCTELLVLKIIYSNEFMDFEEKIYFRQSNTTDDAIQSKKNQIIQQQQKLINELVEIVRKLEKKINKIDNSQLLPIYIYPSTGIIRLKNEPVPFNNMNIMPSKIKFISKNLTNVIFDYSCNRTNNNFQKTLHYCMDFIIFTINSSHKFTVRQNCIFLDINTYKEIFKFLNLKIFAINCNGNGFDNEDENFIFEFLEKTLIASGKKIDELKIETNNIANGFTKYNFYNKLSIPYDKSFNDTSIKEHCKKNNIEFAYIE